MMIKYYFLILIFVFVCCRRTYEYDKTNEYEVAKAIHYAFSNNKEKLIEEILDLKIDSLKWFEVPQYNSAMEFFKHNKDIDIFSIEIEPSIFEIKNEYRLAIYYKTWDNYYCLNSGFKKDSVTGEIIPIFLKLLFRNLTEICEDYKSKPYTPAYCYTDNFNYKLSSSLESFEWGSFEIHNSTDYEINYVKINAEIKYGNSKKEAEHLITQIVVCNELIPSNYKLTIPISSLSNYYTGFPIQSEKLFFHADILEVKPRQESYACKKIEELKREAKQRKGKKWSTIRDTIFEDNTGNLGQQLPKKLSIFQKTEGVQHFKSTNLSLSFYYSKDWQLKNIDEGDKTMNGVMCEHKTKFAYITFFEKEIYGSLEDILAEFSNGLKNVELFKSANFSSIINLNYNDYYAVVSNYSMVYNGNYLKGQIVVFKKGNKAFIINKMSEKSEFESIFKNIEESLTLYY